MPAGGGFVTPALGRPGHHALRHYDRCARCSLQPEPAPAGNPAKLGAALREAWSGLRQGMRESLGQEPLWNAERRARPAGRAPRLASAELRLRLSAFCFLFFLSVRSSAFVPHPDRAGSGLPLPGSSDEGREGGEVLGPGVLIARVRIKKRTARMRLFASLRAKRSNPGRPAMASRSSWIASSLSLLAMTTAR